MLDRGRFEALLPIDVVDQARVLVVGVGGIGSYVAPMLVRMGVESIRLVDHDRVEYVNLATQNYTEANLDRPKALACLEEFNALPIKIERHSRRFAAGDLEGRNVVITALDTLKVRRQVWRAICALKGPKPITIDPRMGAEEVDLWTVRPGTEMARAYEEVLMDPSPAAELPCGARAIAYTGMFIAALVGVAFRRALMEPKWEVHALAHVGHLACKVVKQVGV